VSAVLVICIGSLVFRWDVWHCNTSCLEKHSNFPRTRK